MDAVATTQLVKRLGGAVGCDRVGVTRPWAPQAAAHYRAWLADGYAGEMGYLHRNADIRADPGKLLPGAKSAICIAVNYHRPDRATATAQPTGRVAQYAQGRDYHVVLRRMLDDLTDRLRAELDVTFEARPCVDTAPLLERALAAQAGIGWVGKHTLVLHQDLGSFFFLGVLLTTLELVPDEPLTDRCGTCRRCLDACPTQAFPRPHVLDARRCISYLTIEHRSALPADLQRQMGDWVFGCDVCQDVCPYNAKAPAATHADLTADLVPERLDLLELVELRSAEYRRKFGPSAARRARRPMWRRNAAAALGNLEIHDSAVRAALTRAAADEDETIRTAARVAQQADAGNRSGLNGRPGNGDNMSAG